MITAAEIEPDRSDNNSSFIPHHSNCINNKETLQYLAIKYRVTVARTQMSE